MPPNDLPQKSRCTATATPHIPVISTFFQFPVSFLLDHSVSHKFYPVLYRRSSCSLTPPLHFGSIRLYSPVSFRISLLFVFICSDTHIQSIKLRTSISVSYKSVSKRILAHIRTIIFFSMSFTISFLSGHFM